MGLYDRIANVQNTAPGKIAIIELPCNVTYDKVHLKLGGGLTAANLLRIEGQANGKPFYVTTGADVIAEQKYKGIATDNAWVTLDFTEPNARGGAGPQYAASIPANLLASLKFFITVDAAANPLMTLEAKAEFRGPSTNPFIRKMIDFNAALPNVGDNDLFLPAGASGGIVKRVWLHNTGKITGWDLRVNRLSARRQVQADWQYEQGQNKLAPQANLDVLDFIVDGNLQGALDTSKDAQGKVPSVELRVTVSAAEVVRGYLEYIDPIARL
jgi:hypothetical protein